MRCDDMRFSANLGFLWRDLPFPERIVRAAAAGFDAVEFHDDAQRTDPAKLRSVLVEADLPVVALNTSMREGGLAGVPGRDADARGDIDAALAAAGTMGAGAIHVIAGEADGPAAWETYRASLQYAVERAGGVTVLIEPLCEAARPGYLLHDLDRAVDLARQTGVRVMFDCFHVAMQHGQTLARFQDCVDVIGHVQIASVPERREPTIGEGRLDYAALLPLMREAGYTGAFGCEYVPAGAVEAGLGWREGLRASA